MKQLSFVKMVGAGNDFIVVDNRSGVLPAKGGSASGGKDSLSAIAAQLLDRKRSVGGDGLVLLEKSVRADVRMRIFNPDGSEAAMCGNGIRCLAKLTTNRNIAGPDLSIETGAGVLEAHVRGDIIKVRMADPAGLRLNVPLKLAERKVTAHCVDTGVPHAVLVVDDLEKADVEGLGREVRHHKHFAPKGTNVDFVAFRPGGVGVRTYERGVEDETLSCGTGSTAAALVAAALKNLKSPVKVFTPGGETLSVYFTRAAERFGEVYLEGPVREAFEGRVTL